MLRMYVTTALLAVITWAPLTIYLDRTVITNSILASLLYGGMIPLTVFSFWWNVVDFKNIKPPKILRFIGVVLAAIGLGINSACYYIRFADTHMQQWIQDGSVQYLWLMIEITLIVTLIVGIYHQDQTLVQTQETSHS